ncbi:MAG: hypothetical protein EBV06_13310 [Planctomycetia bacterium]|nr:hypothetical protein [Planctomycetia bacterium]
MAGGLCQRPDSPLLTFPALKMSSEPKALATTQLSIDGAAVFGSEMTWVTQNHTSACIEIVHQPPLGNGNITLISL